MVSIDDVKDGDGNLSKEEFIDMVAKHPKDDVTFDVFFLFELRWIIWNDWKTIRRAREIQLEKTCAALGGWITQIATHFNCEETPCLMLFSPKPPGHLKKTTVV